jgi:hypothetical protein
MCRRRASRLPYSFAGSSRVFCYRVAAVSVNAAG